ncbi:sulfotransferase 1B1-like [Asterias amurensis]|uniref:sulfotransferase 1B1-like n=1 Tax=Asterias amurensis TaxID=7602 RepID=UPI003AB5C330
MATNPLLAMFPPIINGKTHEELLLEIEEYHKSSGVHKLNGNNYSWVMPRANFDAIKTFEVREEDIFNITFPKSGTHWIGEIIHFILHDGRSDFNRENMKSALETTLVMNPSDVNSGVPGYKTYEKIMSNPRVIPTHCQVDLLPPRMWEKKPKVIYLARNPKDLLVSYFNFIKSLLTPSLQTWEGFLFLLMTGQMIGGSWFDHVLGYWEHRNDDNVLFLKYEDLHKDLPGNIRKIATHLGKDLSDDVIATIAEHVTFGGMQKSYQKIEEEQGEEGKLLTRMFGVIPYLNKGKVGSWKSMFTAEQSALFDMLYAEKMKGSGLDFDFEL